MTKYNIRVRGGGNLNVRIGEDFVQVNKLRINLGGSKEPSYNPPQPPRGEGEPRIVYDRPNASKLLETYQRTGQAFPCLTNDYQPKHGEKPGTTSCDGCPIAARRLFPTKDAQDPLRDVAREERYCVVSENTYDMKEIDEELRQMGIITLR